MSQIVVAVALALGLRKPQLKIDTTRTEEKAPSLVCWTTEEGSPKTPQRKSNSRSISRTFSFSLDRTQMPAERVPYGESSEEDES
jgi:hypothetical protein